MIINTGLRTDIPAFYSEWFVNRLRAGFVMVRNPYNPKLVNKTFLAMMQRLGYDVRLTYEKRKGAADNE